MSEFSHIPETVQSLNLYLDYAHKEIARLARKDKELRLEITECERRLTLKGAVIKKIK